MQADYPVETTTKKVDQSYSENMFEMTILIKLMKYCHDVNKIPGIIEENFLSNMSIHQSPN